MLWINRLEKCLMLSKDEKDFLQNENQFICQALYYHCKNLWLSKLLSIARIVIWLVPENQNHYSRFMWRKKKLNR